MVLQNQESGLFMMIINMKLVDIFSPPFQHLGWVELRSLAIISGSEVEALSPMSSPRWEDSGEFPPKNVYQHCMILRGHDGIMSNDVLIWIYMSHLHVKHPKKSSIKSNDLQSEIIFSQGHTPHTCHGQKSLYWGWSSHLLIGIRTMGI